MVNLSRLFLVATVQVCLQNLGVCNSYITSTRDISVLCLGMRLLCSKLYRLCYAKMLQTMSDYILGVSLAIMLIQQVNQI